MLNNLNKTTFGNGTEINTTPGFELNNEAKSTRSKKPSL